ncbi:MAG: hypothetical protein EOP09_02635 [Proteobacteria bacterium]|nr:MAG: hypothetical protein EOP09_02635 [Pseudomonadota bacterium]
MANGAIKLRRIIKQLQSRTMPTDLALVQVERDLIRIEKRTKESESRTEFAFLLRITNVGSSESWWPIEYRSATEVVSCESVINGKVMVNLVKQDGLVELAETWAKTLEAQQVTSTVGNALL